MILFVEDDLITQFIYQDWFGQNPAFKLAESISEARDVIANEEVTCIVADIHLTDGLIFDLKQEIENLSVPVALAFGSNMRPEEQVLLEHFPFTIKFKKPLDKAVLEEWFTSLNVW
jgi:response regulator of citrate/malate metabolism